MVQRLYRWRRTYTINKGLWYDKRDIWGRQSKARHRTHLLNMPCNGKNFRLWNVERDRISDYQFCKTLYCILRYQAASNAIRHNLYLIYITITENKVTSWFSQTVDLLLLFPQNWRSISVLYPAGWVEIARNILYLAGPDSGLTHWGRDKMDAISQTTFSSAFSWMKMFEFLSKFHWSLFQRVKHNSSNVSDNGLAPSRRQAIIWSNAG